MSGIHLGMPVNDCSIQLARGPEADRLLADETFVAEWEALCAGCPWATGFQGAGFARAWYGTYRHRCEPVLVHSRAPAAAGGALQGLLALAYFPVPRTSEPGQTLVVAGGLQAEYHAWVSTPALGDAFPRRAVEALRREFPSSRLTFHYLAPGAPTAWATGPEGRRRCVLRAHRRPLVRFGGGADNAASLAKKSNKRRLKDLDKMGGLEFKRITDPAEFEQLFDPIVRLYDFRHGAVQGSSPFCTLDLQKQFHVAMMKVPGLLHVTAMRVGGRLAAAHFGVVSGKELQLGTIVHDPALAKQSPGKFQILLLNKMLIGEGFQRLDLTPGGDAYKERFANDWDVVHTLTVLPTAGARTKAFASAFASARVKDVLERVLARRGLSTAEAGHRVKAALEAMKHPAAVAAAVIRGVCGWAASRRQTRVYWRTVGAVDRAQGCPVSLVSPLAASQTTGAGIAGGLGCPPGTAPVCEAASGGRASAIDAAPPAPPVRRDSLDDLLAYRAAGAGQSRQAFLSAALRRVEEGRHPYTIAAGGELRCCAWLAERPDAELLAALLPGLTIPPGSAVLHGFHEFASAATPSGPSVYDRLLRAMLHDIGRAMGVRHVFLVLPEGEAASRPLARLAQEFGFVHDGSLIEETRFGRRHPRAQVARPSAVSAPTPTTAAPVESTVSAVSAEPTPVEPKEGSASAHPVCAAACAGPTRKSLEGRQRPVPAGAAPPDVFLSGKTL